MYSMSDYKLCAIEVRIKRLPNTIISDTTSLDSDASDELVSISRKRRRLEEDGISPVLTCNETQHNIVSGPYRSEVSSSDGVLSIHSEGDAAALSRRLPPEACARSNYSVVPPLRCHPYSQYENSSKLYLTPNDHLFPAATKEKAAILSAAMEIDITGECIVPLTQFLFHDNNHRRYVIPSHIFVSHKGNKVSIEGRITNMKEGPTSCSGLLEKLSIEPLMDVSVHTISRVYAQTSVAKAHNVWYELALDCPADEYSEYWSDFLWIANLTKHVSDFLEHKRRLTKTFDAALIDFKHDFYRFLCIHHGAEVTFQDWLDKAAKSTAVPCTDFRQHLIAHHAFIWSSLYQFPISRSKVFQELSCDSLKEHKWSDEDKTIVTPYVHECFRHIFGSLLKKAQKSRGNWKRMSHVEIYELSTPQNRNADWTSQDIQVGDVVYFDAPDPSTDNLWQQPAALKINKARSSLADPLASSNSNGASSSREYMYITEAFHKSNGKAKYRGLHCYLPGTWHTQLGSSFYPHSTTELFLSDHCNCCEQYDQHRLLDFDEIDGKVSVNFLCDATKGHDFFCRTFYLHAEGNFRSLTPQDLNPHATSLPCGCQTRRMHGLGTPQAPCYKVKAGRTVLVNARRLLRQRARDNRLEPYVIVAVDSERYVLRRWQRRSDLKAVTRKDIQLSLPEHNELLLTDEHVNLDQAQFHLIARSCGVWYIPNSSGNERVLHLQGAGEQFWFRNRLSTDGVESQCPSADLEVLSFKSATIATASELSKKLVGLDLFCGAGNLGEGIRDAGIVQYKAAIDLYKDALHTYQANHEVKSDDDCSFDTEFYHGSVNRYLAKAIEHNEKGIDFIVGGSPCQGFSAANIHKGNLLGLRNCSLVASFASYIDHYRPKYAVLENVKGLADNVRLPDGKVINVHRQLLACAVGTGYQVRTFIDHAWHHGSAQSRIRTFVVFAAPGLTLPQVPIESHSCIGRRSKTLLNPHGLPYHNPNDNDEPRAFDALCAKDIWHDLPVLNPDRPCLSHPDHRSSVYANPKIRQMCHYVAYRDDPRRVSVKARQREARCAEEMHQVGAMPKALVKHYPKQFIEGSKSFSRMSSNKFVPTVLTSLVPQARLGSAVLHPNEPRVMSILEAKRAQGFLDGDVMLGSSASIMKQIGNSVSRHASYAIGLSLRDAMLIDLPRRASPDLIDLT